MKYREGRVEYFGRKGMSILGNMLVQWKLRSTINLGEENKPQVFEYTFTNYTSKGYGEKDHVQVPSAIKDLIKKIKEHFAKIKNDIFHSDNDSFFASQDFITFIFNIKENYTQVKNPIIVRRLFVEAQTRRGRLDIHLLFIYFISISCVEYGNNIDLEEHIINDFKFHGGTTGTTGILLDCIMLLKVAPKKSFKSNYSKTRETYDIWKYIRCYHTNFFRNNFT